MRTIKAWEYSGQDCAEVVFNLRNKVSDSFRCIFSFNRRKFYSLNTVKFVRNLTKYKFLLYIVNIYQEFYRVQVSTVVNICPEFYPSTRFYCIL